MNNTHECTQYLWSAVLGTALMRDNLHICDELVDDYINAYHIDQEDTTALQELKTRTIKIWLQEMAEVKDDFESFTVVRWGS